MTGSPLVSVVLIFLNEQRFLSEAVESVVAQSFADWELVLVDDGSTDQSSEVARNYARRMPDRVRYLDHPGHENQGMSASRNLGIGSARGEFVAFLDGDDVWIHDKLARQVAILRACPAAGFVAGVKEFWFSWTGLPGDGTRDVRQQFPMAADQLVHPPQLLKAFLQDESAVLLDVLLRRSVIEAVQGYEESFRGLYEDQVFHAKLCLRYPAWLTSDVGVRYRQHPMSCAISSDPHRKREAREQYLRWLTEHMAFQGERDRGLWRTVRRESLPFRHPRLAKAREWLRAVRRQLVGGATTGPSGPRSR